MISKLKVAGSIPVARSKTVFNPVSKARPGTLARTFLLLASALLVPSFAMAQDVSTDEPPPVTVLNFRWAKDRRPIENADTSQSSPPAPAMIAANKNFEKQRRVNDPAGVRDPNADTLDGRSAELDRIVAESRDTKPPVDGFTYQLKIQNNGAKAATAIFWEYQFRDKTAPTLVSRRQFVCLVKVKPEKMRELEIFTLTAPTGVVSVGTLGKKSEKPFEELALINRVEFDDGTAWQRKDWSYDEVKLTAKPPSDSKKLQMCRGL